MLGAGVSGFGSDGDKEFAAGCSLNNLFLGSTQPAVSTPSATTGTAAMSKDEGTATAITMAMAVSATNQINRWTRRRPDFSRHITRMIINLKKAGSNRL